MKAMKLKDRLIRLLGGYTMVRMPVSSCERKIETLKVGYRLSRVPADDTIAHIEKDMAIKLAFKMMEEGFIAYSSNAERENCIEPLEIYAIVHVVRPVKEWL